MSRLRLHQALTLMLEQDEPDQRRLADAVSGGRGSPVDLEPAAVAAQVRRLRVDDPDSSGCELPAAAGETALGAVERHLAWLASVCAGPQALELDDLPALLAS